MLRNMASIFFPVIAWKPLITCWRVSNVLLFVLQLWGRACLTTAGLLLDVSRTATPYVQLGKKTGLD